MTRTAASIVAVLCALAAGCGPAAQEPSAAPGTSSPAPVERSDGPDGRGRSPLSVAVTYSPQRPIAGDEVTFHVVVDDVDAKIARNCLSYHWFGSENAIPGRCVAACTPPDPDAADPEPVRGHLEEELVHTYERPGRYTAVFHYSSDQHCTRTPFGSEGEARVTVEVAPA